MPRKYIRNIDKHKPGMAKIISPGDLSPMQKEIIEMLADGHTRVEAMKRLKISENTLVNHLAKASILMNTRNTNHLIAECVRQKLVGMREFRGSFGVDESGSINFFCTINRVPADQIRSGLLKLINILNEEIEKTHHEL